MSLLVAYPEGLDSCNRISFDKLNPMARAALSQPMAFWKAKQEQVQDAYKNAIGATMMDLRRATAMAQKDERWIFTLGGRSGNDDASIHTALTDSDVVIEEFKEDYYYFNVAMGDKFHMVSGRNKMY